jgi:hypothetical protein
MPLPELLVHMGAQCLLLQLWYRDERSAVQHPGFDFSGATFNGKAPEANAFMGGMST